MNVVTLTGRVIRDAELRRTKNGKPVSVFSLAVHRPGSNGVEDFIGCLAWDKRADFIYHHFKKGRLVEVSGVLITRTYEKNGEKRRVVEVCCNHVDLVDKNPEDGNESGYTPEQPSGFQDMQDDSGDIPF